MQTIHELADAIIHREGGFVNDPDDPGGLTNKGVTLATLRRLERDINGDGSVDTADVRALDARTARDIYVKHYFKAPGIAGLPDILHATVFDMYVNAGANAVKILQKLLNAMEIPVTADGQIGPQTIAACERAARIAPDHFSDAYGIERRNYYYRLGDQRPALRKFARRQDGGKGGWINRAEEFIAPKYHFSELEHHERVASWG